MSDFQLSRSQRRRLLEGNYAALKFKGATCPDNSDPLPFGCKVGARYVLAYRQKQLRVVEHKDGAEPYVHHVPKHPAWFLTVTAVLRRPDGSWLVKFEVTDVRDDAEFLRPGGGWQKNWDPLDAGARPDPVWLETRHRAIGEFDHQRRLARHAEKMRGQHRARRRRAA